MATWRGFFCSSFARQDFSLSPHPTLLLKGEGVIARCWCELGGKALSLQEEGGVGAQVMALTSLFVAEPALAPAAAPVRREGDDAHAGRDVRVEHAVVPV